MSKAGKVTSLRAFCILKGVLLLGVSRGSRSAAEKVSTRKKAEQNRLGLTKTEAQLRNI
jgi:hypothetical protein